MQKAVSINCRAMRAATKRKPLLPWQCISAFTVHSADKFASSSQIHILLPTYHVCRLIKWELTEYLYTRAWNPPCRPNMLAKCTCIVAIVLWQLWLFWIRHELWSAVGEKHVRWHRGSMAGTEISLQCRPRQHRSLWPEHRHCSNRSPCYALPGRCGRASLAAHVRHACGIPSCQAHVLSRCFQQVCAFQVLIVYIYCHITQWVTW